MSERLKSILFGIACLVLAKLVVQHGPSMYLRMRGYEVDTERHSGDEFDARPQTIDYKAKLDSLKMDFPKYELKKIEPIHTDLGAKIDSIQEKLDSIKINMTKYEFKKIEPIPFE